MRAHLIPCNNAKHNIIALDDLKNDDVSEVNRESVEVSRVEVDGVCSVCV
jgi:hypothetical protein